jgi:hypothetical protein
LGHTVAECDRVEAAAYTQKARDILAEMTKIQALDPEGGVLYGVSASGAIADFPQAPSAAGTTWLLMVLRALDDKATRDAFWGPDPDIIHCIGIAGPRFGWVGVPHTFTAAVSPITVTLPITYVWRADGQSTVTHTAGLSDAVAFGWETSGLWGITVTAKSAHNAVTDTHVIYSSCSMWLPIIMKDGT